MTAIDPNLRLSDFDYDLPEELIAQSPPAERDGGRLLLVDRTTGTLTDLTVRDLPELLRGSDILVTNNTRVLPARLKGQRDTGGAIEVLLLNRIGPGHWAALGKPARKMTDNSTFRLLGNDPAVSAEAQIVQNHGEGRIEIQFESDIDDRLAQFGETPLPPYIRESVADAERYQTVFSSVPGSVAAPTAGLHLSDDLLSRMHAQGISRYDVTLQIGLDTFRPVTAERLVDHHMHSEWCSVPEKTARAIATTRAAGGRVVAVGTTSARTLESWGGRKRDGQVGDWEEWTSIFITPGYRWQAVEALLTNFHLPRSTLLMMICSFAGTELAFAAYRHAVQQRYRFFSFGDAMLIV